LFPLGNYHVVHPGAIMKIYVSSTFEDLRDHRAAFDIALHRMGHDVIGMEHYVAEGTTPLERCVADVRSSDIYIVIVAWRYGYIPRGECVNPQGRSITELEYEAAVGSGKSILAFLLDPVAPWPPSFMDSLSEAGGAEILRFRNVLGGRHLAGIFRGPDNLAGLGAPAVAVQGMTKHMGERALKQDRVSAVMNPFFTGADLHDTTLHAIREMVANAGMTRALVIDIDQGTWWSTRLYLLATLLQSLTSVRQLVFAHSGGQFAGMASPAAVREGLSAVFPEIATFDTELRHEGGSQDSEREINRCIDLWNVQMRGKEFMLKVGVRWPLVIEWLGERLITRCITIDADAGLTTIQAQKIIESLILDVPVEERTLLPAEGSVPSPAPRLMVVDRDAFALEVAREWVRTGLPRER
jgi:hypothetical protein